jgi:hypothetical protein
VNLGLYPEAVAVGGGTLWVTTPSGFAGGQIRRVNPATGKVIRTLHLSAGRCTYVAYSGAHLFAGCEGRHPGSIVFVGLDPRTGQVQWRSAPVSGLITQIIATPQGIWYADRNSGIAGPVAAAWSGPPPVPDVPRRISFANPQSLVYGDGFAWTLASDESVSKIDPMTGRVVRYYTYRDYDPAFLGGLDNLAVGGGSLWLLDDGPLTAKGTSFAGVLQVSEATGRPIGRIPGIIAPGSCGPGPCTQIYYAGGAVWVPTLSSLIRIDPSRMTGQPVALPAGVP